MRGLAVPSVLASSGRLLEGLNAVAAAVGKELSWGATGQRIQRRQTLEPALQHVNPRDELSNPVRVVEAGSSLVALSDGLVVFLFQMLL